MHASGNVSPAGSSGFGRLPNKWLLDERSGLARCSRCSEQGKPRCSMCPWPWIRNRLPSSKRFSWSRFSSIVLLEAEFR